MKTVVSFLVAALALAGAAPAAAQGAREVSYTPRSVVRCNAKLRFTTMVILPDEEDILDFVCGDKEFWVVSGASEPRLREARQGRRDHQPQSGHRERPRLFVRADRGPAEPDLKVFVKPDAAMTPPRPAGRRSSTRPPRSTISGKEADDARKDADDARTQLDAAPRIDDQDCRRQGQRLSRGVSATLQFPYRFKANQKPFNVSAIFTDGRFTYIRADAPELPALYETLMPGRATSSPRISINFQVETRALHRPQGPGERVSGDREAEARLPSGPVAEAFMTTPTERLTTRRPRRLRRPSAIADEASRRAAAACADVADDRHRDHHPRHHSACRASATRAASAGRQSTGGADARPSRAHPQLPAAARRRCCAREQQALDQAASEARATRPPSTPSVAATDPTADDQRRREYQSLFADNVALSRRSPDRRPFGEPRQPDTTAPPTPSQTVPDLSLLEQLLTRNASAPAPTRNTPQGPLPPTVASSPLSGAEAPRPADAIRRRRPRRRKRPRFVRATRFNAWSRAP